MPVPARATLGLQLRPPGAASARRRGRAASSRTARPLRASAEPEEERVYVAPNWVSWAPLPASPAAGNRSDVLATPPAASPGMPPPAGLARLSRAEAAGIVMAAAFGLGAPLPGAEQARFTRRLVAHCTQRWAHPATARQRIALAGEELTRLRARAGPCGADSAVDVAAPHEAPLLFVQPVRSAHASASEPSGAGNRHHVRAVQARSWALRAAFRAPASCGAFLRTAPRARALRLTLSRAAATPSAWCTTSSWTTWASFTSWRRAHTAANAT